MLESKLWYNRTETKNAMVAKMVESIKTCDQYPCKFNFGHFFSSKSALSTEEKYKKTLFGGNCQLPLVWSSTGKNLGEIFA